MLPVSAGPGPCRGWGGVWALGPGAGAWEVGLSAMLVLLVELVEITWTQLGINVLPHQAGR